jgi:RNA polymerase sigma-70 factor, ECF subfamily
MAMRPAGAADDAPLASAAPRDFEAAYQEWFSQVVRWLPAMGARAGEVEDLAQETFLVVERKLASFQGGSFAAWLYAIALRVCSNHRRLAWFRSVVFFPADDPVFDGGGALSATPDQALERKQLSALADEVLSGMSAKHRRAFVLFEIEEYSGEEIAALESIPLATVWTRVHHARKEFMARAEKVREREQVK